MTSPIDSLRFVHDAILRESARIDDAVHGHLDPKGAEQLRAEVAFFADLVHKHTHGEEVGLFPRLVEREPHFAETYLHDHADERALFRELEDLLARVARGDSSALPLARRTSTALRSHASAHVEKENRYVLPFVAASFDVPAQAAIVQAILATIPPEDMPRVVPFIVDRVGDESACAYVGVLSRVMPPPVYEKAKSWIRAGCQADRVALLSERVPSFA